MSEVSGFFGEFDIAGADADPFETKAGTYKAVITGTKLREGTKNRQDENGSSIELPYKGLSVEFGLMDGTAYDHFFSLPVDTDSAQAIKFKKSSLHNFLAGLEIPKSRMNTISPEELDHTECVITLKKNNRGFMNIEVQLPKGTSLKQDAPENEFGL